MRMLVWCGCSSGADARLVQMSGADARLVRMLSDALVCSSDADAADARLMRMLV